MLRPPLGRGIPRSTASGITDLPVAA